MFVPLYSGFESDVHPNNLAEFTCDDASIINDWWMVNDGVADCADGSDEGFDYADWPNETISAGFNALQGGYWFEGTLMSGDFVLVDAFSNSFAAGDQGSVQYKALHPNGVLNGMDYEFDFRARWLFRYIDTLVDYDLNYTVTDSNSNIVANGTHSQIDSRSLSACASNW